LDDTDDVMLHLALKKIDAFSGIGHGFYFWNFRTDLYEPQWSYLAALDRGWIPRGNLNDDRIKNACAREDEGAFKCVLKRGQIDKPVREAVKFCLGAEGLSDSPQAAEILNKTGQDFQDAAANVLTDYFEKHRMEGVTCDFGGIAMLIELNRTLSDDDSLGIDDDEYYTRYIIKEGPTKWMLAIGGVGVGLLGVVLGFIIAMRRSPRFNQRVRSTAFLQPLVRSQNSLIRSSLALPELGRDYEEIRSLVENQKTTSTRNDSGFFF
jgi:hypothetical protein